MNKALAQFGNVSVQHFLLFSMAGVMVVLLVTLIRDFWMHWKRNTKKITG